MKQGRKKILFVAMANSIHTARWLNLLHGGEWEIHLFPVLDRTLHPEIKDVIHHRLRGEGQLPLAEQLAEVIRQLQPEYIHTLETTLAGYLTLEARDRLGGRIPKWLHSIWGSDLYLFARLKAHKEKIRTVLAAVDMLFCEGHRDIRLAKEMGYNGNYAPLIHAGGGYSPEEVLSLQNQESPSRRKTILVKGYQGWAGRSLVALRALVRCAHRLAGFEVILFSANTQEIQFAMELFEEKTGIKTTRLHHLTPHRELLKYHASARLFIGLSISDGLPASLLEAMAMGAFPVQSGTSTADEWIEDGRTGILVPPEDPEDVEKAIIRALSDDRLVDEAARINLETVIKRLNRDKIKKEVRELYRRQK
jgi:hypothetical protein